MSFIKRVFGFGRQTDIDRKYDQIRRDLSRLNAGEFVVTHASNTMDSRLMLVVNIVTVLGDRATAQERDAIKKILAAIVYVEQADGYINTIGTLGTLLSEAKDDVIRKTIEEVFEQVEHNFMRVRPEESKPFLDLVRIARAGDMEKYDAQLKTMG